MRGASLRVHRSRGWPIFQWTLTDGLTRIDLEVEGPAGTTLAAGGGAQRTIADPEALLRRIKGTASPGIYLLLDFHPFLDSPLHVRLIKDIAQSHGAAARTLVFVSHELKLPVELEHLAARLPLQLPGKPERQMIVMRAIEEWTDRHQGKASTRAPPRRSRTTSPASRRAMRCGSRARRCSTTARSVWRTSAPRSRTSTDC